MSDPANPPCTELSAPDPMEYYFQNRRLRRTPAVSITRFREFVIEVNEVLRDMPESFWSCRQALASLGCSGAILDYTEHELINGLQDPQYIPSFTLLECDRFNLILRPVMPHSPASVLQSAAFHRMIYVVRGTAQLSRFQQPTPQPVDVFDPSRKIVPFGTLTMNSGDVAELRAAIDCSDLTANDIAILLEMRSAPLYDYEWHYDRLSMSPKRILSTNAGDMQAEIALLTARNLESSDSVPSIRTFLGHANHWIRWSAIQTLLKLDPQNAAGYLNIAQQDAHPRIRSAVRRLWPSNAETKEIIHGIDIADANG